METIRTVNGYSVIKVKRNATGSYAILYNGVISQYQFNGSTLKHYINKSDSEFIQFCKDIFKN